MDHIVSSEEQIMKHHLSKVDEEFRNLDLLINTTQLIVISRENTFLKTKTNAFTDLELGGALYI